MGSRLRAHRRARLTTSYTRIGGVERDLPDGFDGRLRREHCAAWVSCADEIDKLLTRNRIFMDRVKRAPAPSTPKRRPSITASPVRCLRACGVPYDVRKAYPYLVYDRLEFEVPIGTHGDNYDRYALRIEEMKQSARIVRAAGPLIRSPPDR